MLPLMWPLLQQQGWHLGSLVLGDSHRCTCCRRLSSLTELGSHCFQGDVLGQALSAGEGSREAGSWPAAGPPEHPPCGSVRPILPLLPLCPPDF